jgi:purine-binding chemotaxis protein CheW
MKETLPEIDFSAHDLPDLTNSLFFDKQNPQAAGEKFIVFFLDDELFAVSARKVSEVVHPPGITSLPNVPAWLLGIANLRGDIISVVDLQKLWRKKTSQNSTKAKLIVLRGQNSDSPIAFTVDKLSEIITLPNDKIHFCEEASSHIFGKTFHKSNVLNLIDTEKLVLSLELHA